jgi:hypothetical protein
MHTSHEVDQLLLQQRDRAMTFNKQPTQQESRGMKEEMHGKDTSLIVSDISRAEEHQLIGEEYEVHLNDNFPEDNG